MSEKKDIRDDTELLNSLAILLQHDPNLRTNIIHSCQVLLDIMKRNNSTEVEITLEPESKKNEPVSAQTSEPYFEKGDLNVENKVTEYIQPLLKHFEQLQLSCIRVDDKIISEAFDMESTVINSYKLTGGLDKHRGVRFILTHKFDKDNVTLDVSVLFEIFQTKTISKFIKVDRGESQINDFYSAAFIKAYELWLNGSEVEEIFNIGPNFITVKHDIVNITTFN